MAYAMRCNRFPQKGCAARLLQDMEVLGKLGLMTFVDGGSPTVRTTSAEDAQRFMEKASQQSSAAENWVRDTFHQVVIFCSSLFVQWVWLILASRFMPHSAMHPLCVQPALMTALPTVISAMEAHTELVVMAKDFIAFLRNQSQADDTVRVAAQLFMHCRLWQCL
jgi:hypothetical protein